MNFENDFIILELSRRLEKARFLGSDKSASLNFRCPLCGDSKYNKNKRRGYIYQKDGGVWFSCFNCSTNLSLRNFLKETNDDLFRRYTLERIKGYKKEKENKREDVTFSIDGLIPLKTLPKNHPAFEYMLSRKIPVQKWQFVYYCEKLKEKLECPFNDGVIFSSSPSLFVVRNIDKNSKFRYYVKKSSDNVVFGEDFINSKMPVKVCEGLIDSLFLNNCVPALNSNLVSVGKRYKEPVLIWDNEPRNKEICLKIHNALKQGFECVIYPKEVESFKDINEMVLAGVDVENLVLKNKYKGVLGLLKFNLWKRVDF